MEIVVRTEVDKLRDLNEFLTRAFEMRTELCRKYEQIIYELELKNKELQAEVERLNLLCLSPFK